MVEQVVSNWAELFRAKQGPTANKSPLSCSLRLVLGCIRGFHSHMVTACRPLFASLMGYGCLRPYKVDPQFHCVIPSTTMINPPLSLSPWLKAPFSLIRKLTGSSRRWSIRKCERISFKPGNLDIGMLAQSPNGWWRTPHALVPRRLIPKKI